MMTYLAPLFWGGVILWMTLRSRRSMRARLTASLQAQQVDIGGTRVAGSRLQVLYRWTGARGRPSQGLWWVGRSSTWANMDDSWLCRAPDGTYVLAIAQGCMVPIQPDHRWSPARMEITWVFRILSEQRARASLAYKRNAYRRVFGDDPSSRAANDRHSPPNSS